MAPTYYVIELSARWLTALLIALALVMVLAFAFGYGAAWTVLSPGGAQAQDPIAELADDAAPPPTIVEEVILDESTPTPRPTRPPQPTPKPQPTRAPTATPEPVVDSPEGYWVQVLASSTEQTVRQAQDKLDDLGFPKQNQNVSTTQVAGGNALHKLRVGPFPDRESADRVVRRMRASGYPDAWVVVP
jgi:cell division septation protein DedD